MNWLEKHPFFQSGLINPRLKKIEWCGIFGHIHLYAKILDFVCPEGYELEEFNEELKDEIQKLCWIRFVLWEKQKTMTVDRFDLYVHTYKAFLEELAEAWGYELEIN